MKLDVARQYKLVPNIGVGDKKWFLIKRRRSIHASASDTRQKKPTTANRQRLEAAIAEVQRRTVRDMRAAEARAKLELAEARESSDVAAQAATVEKTKLEGRLAAVQSRLDELVSTMTASTTMPQKLQQGTFGGGMLSPLSSPIATHTTPTRNGTKVGSFMDVTGAMIETPTILNMSLVSANHQMKMGGMGRLGIHALHDDIDTDIFGSLGLQPGHQPMQSDAVGGGGVVLAVLGVGALGVL